MYPFVSLVSFVIRAGICYLTIESVPIFQNELIALVIGQILSLYTLLRVVSYSIIANKFNYRKGEAPILGVGLYMMVYILLSLLLWAILWILSWVGILPI
ncbi:hypothetical protein KC960_04280 [Candidatus Saccharibacteria bacterium]|nr:hypothetical protein [Candidatus Saccharibacteria bacterium]